MADFGVQATQLSAPQGAGAQVVEPVSYKTAPIDLSGVGNVINAVSNIVKSNNEKDAEARKSSALADVNAKISAIAQGAETGQLTNTAAATATRAVYQSYAGMYPDLVPDLQKQANFLKEFGTTGAIISEADKTAEIRNTQVAKMVARGIPIDANSTKQTVDLALKQDAAATRMAEGVKELRETMEFEQKQATWDEADFKRRSERKVNEYLTDIGNASYNTYASLISDLLSDQAQGKDTTAKQASVKQYYYQIRGEITKLGVSSPAVAKEYMSLFDKITADHVDNMKTGADADAAKKEVEKIITFNQLEYLKTPGAPRGVAISKFYPNNPYVINGAMPGIQSFVTGAALTNDQVAARGGVTPPPNEVIVGHPMKEKDLIKTVTESIKIANNSDPKDKEAIRNLVDSTVKLFGKEFDAQTLSPDSRATIFKFFGNSNVARFVKENSLPAETINKLNTMFQRGYIDNFEQGLQKKLQEVILVQGAVTPRADGFKGIGKDVFAIKYAPGQSEKPVSELVDISFNTMGLVITPKPGVALDAGVMVSLRKVQDSASQIVNIGASINRMEPQAYWERNKSMFLGSVFPSSENKGSSSTINMNPSPVSVPTEKSMIPLVKIAPNEAIPDGTKASRIKEIETELSRKGLSPMMIDILNKELVKERNSP